MIVHNTYLIGNVESSGESGPVIGGNKVEMARTLPGKSKHRHVSIQSAIAPETNSPDLHLLFPANKTQTICEQTNKIYIIGDTDVIFYRSAVQGKTNINFMHCSTHIKENIITVNALKSG